MRERRLRQVAAGLLALPLAAALAQPSAALAVAHATQAAPVYGGIVVECRDSQTGRVPQGDARFDGMVLSVENASALSVSVGGKSYGPSEEICRLVTDADGRAATADDLLPQGDYLVRLVEANPTMTATAPCGIARVRLPGQMVALSGGSSFYDAVARGSVSTSLVDAETDLPEPLGAASLQGARFAVTNLSEHPVVVDGTKAAPGERACVLEYGSDGLSAEDELLPVGRYAIEQIAPGRGYLPGDGSPVEFAVEERGGVAEALPDAGSFSNEVVRGDVRFTVVDGETMQRRAHVPFALESLTTGETHVVVTDGNGFASTASAWNPHDSLTNGADDLLVLQGESAATGVSVAAQREGTGVWFGASADGALAPVDNGKGALPFDTYRLTEIPGADDGIEPIVISGITISRDGAVVDLGTVDGKRRASADDGRQPAAFAQAGEDGPAPRASVAIGQESAPRSDGPSASAGGSDESAGEPSANVGSEPGQIAGADPDGAGAATDAQGNGTSAVGSAEGAAGQAKGASREPLDASLATAKGDGTRATASAGAKKETGEARAPEGGRDSSAAQPLPKTADSALPTTAASLLAASGALLALGTTARRKAGMGALPGAVKPARRRRRLPTFARSGRTAPAWVPAALALAAACALSALPGAAYGVTLVADAPDGVPPSEIVFDYDRGVAALKPVVTKSADCPASIRVDVSGGGWKAYRSYWTGPVDGEVSIPGTVTYAVDDVGFDLDGDRVDLRIDISNITFAHRADGALDRPFCIAELWVNDRTREWSFVLTSWCLTGEDEYYAAGSRNIATRVYKHGTTRPANGRFISQVVDLDIADLDLSTGTALDDYRGPYTEQVQLLSGFDDEVHVSRDCALDISAQTATFRATCVDDDTLKSGFVVALDARGSVMHWRGRNCGTTMLVPYGSAVITASAGPGGTISSPGRTVVGWRHSKAYAVTPAEGYRIGSVTVDGKQIGAPASYTFEDVRADHSIAASFLPNGYRVRFDANGGDGSMEDQPMVYDRKERLRPCAFERPGYRFAGWDTAPEGGALGFDDEQEVSNLCVEDGGAVTLYALWVENDAVAILYNSGDPDHGSVDVPMEKLPPATGVAEGSSASALTGYHVREWRDRAGNVVGDGDRYTPTRNEGALWEECRFVAIIEPNACRIAYEPGEGTGAMADSWHRYDEESPLSECAFENPGHHVVGWEDEQGERYALDATVLNLTDEDGGTVTLRALWEADPPADDPGDEPGGDGPEPPDEPTPPADDPDGPNGDVGPDDPGTSDEPDAPGEPSGPAGPDGPSGDDGQGAQPGTDAPWPPSTDAPGTDQGAPGDHGSDVAPDKDGPVEKPSAPVATPSGADKGKGLAKTQDGLVGAAALATAACAAAGAVALVAVNRRKRERKRRARALSSLKRANEVLLR